MTKPPSTLSTSDYTFYNPTTDILNHMMICGSSSKTINNLRKIRSVLVGFFAFEKLFEILSS